STSIKPMTEPFDLTRFHELLQTETLGRDLIFEPSVPSTMDLARDAALHAAPEGLVALADEQTAGRGRLGRSWISPPPRRPPPPRHQPRQRARPRRRPRAAPRRLPPPLRAPLRSRQSRRLPVRRLEAPPRHHRSARPRHLPHRHPRRSRRRRGPRWRPP